MIARLLTGLWAILTWAFTDTRDLRGMTEQEYDDWDYYEALSENVGLSQRDQEYLETLRSKRGIQCKSKKNVGKHIPMRSYED